MAKTMKKRKTDKGIMSKKHRVNISKGMKASSKVKAAAKKRGAKMSGKKRRPAKKRTK